MLRRGPMYKTRGLCTNGKKDHEFVPDHAPKKGQLVFLMWLKLSNKQNKHFAGHFQ